MSESTERFLLHHDSYTAGPDKPERWLLLLHGILGSGSNWRTFARRLCAARPQWGVVTADLRLHGASLAAPGPHSVARCVDDLEALSSHLGISFTAIGGHSFGSKVALLFAERLVARHTDLDALWILDAEVAARSDRLTSGDDTVQRILGYLEAMPPYFDKRTEFTDRLLAEGLTQGVADWLAMNLGRDGERLRLSTDVAAIRGLLSDYLALDGTVALEQVLARADVHVVLGGRSDTVSASGRSYYEGLAASDQIDLKVLPDAGHWVHVDAFRELLDHFADALS
ncbi:MAG: alpha/beta hydrolase [Planctomycetota bacterium]